MSAYTVIVTPPEGFPRDLVVRVVVMRKDGDAMTRAELERCAEAFPPGPKQRAQLRRDLEMAPEARPAKKTPKSKPAASKPSKAPAKRAAARRPTRSRA